MAGRKPAQGANDVQAQQRATSGKQDGVPQNLPAPKVHVVAPLLVDRRVTLKQAEVCGRREPGRLHESDSRISFQHLEGAFQGILLRLPVGIQQIHQFDAPGL